MLIPAFELSTRVDAVKSFIILILTMGIMMNSSAADTSSFVEVEGVLTDEGVECPVMRDSQGAIYSLMGDLQGFGPGDLIRIKGRVAEISKCMQGTTLRIIELERMQTFASLILRDD